jgi:hypothetical protein
MLGNISAQVALLAFAAAIVAGLFVGNSPATVLIRALVAMFVALLVGKLASWAIKLVLRDHLQRKKLAIDQAHSSVAQPSAPEGPGEESDTLDTG